LIKHHQITIAYCVMCNYCEMWGASKPKLANARIKGDNLIGFGVDRLFILRKGQKAKEKGERSRRVIFEQ